MILREVPALGTDNHLTQVPKVLLVIDEFRRLVTVFAGPKMVVSVWICLLLRSCAGSIVDTFVGRTESRLACVAPFWCPLNWHCALRVRVFVIIRCRVSVNIS
jgi:hypothetical protein